MEIIFLKEKTFTYNVHMSDFLMNNIFSYYLYFFSAENVSNAVH